MAVERGIEIEPTNGSLDVWDGKGKVRVLTTYEVWVPRGYTYFDCHSYVEHGMAAARAKAREIAKARDEGTLEKCEPDCEAGDGE